MECVYKSTFGLSFVGRFCLLSECSLFHCNVFCTGDNRREVFYALVWVP